MFERFTERARKVVVLAQEEAERFNHNYLGTEHLLLGLLKEKKGVLKDRRGVAARALTTCGVTLDRARDQVEGIVGYGEEGTGGGAPFTPRAKKVFELALREALQLGHNYIGTEHILLGLVRESEGVAARVLSNLDVDPDEVRREVVRMLGGGRAYTTFAEPVEGAPAAGYSSALAKFPDTLLLMSMEGLEVQARYGASEEERSRPRRFIVDLECTCDEARLSEGVAVASPEVVLGGVAGTLGGRDFPSLPEAVKRVGGYVLDTFPEITEVTVKITDTHEGNEELPVSKVSVTKVFSRFFRT